MTKKLSFFVINVLSRNLLTKIIKYVIMNMSRKLEYNKKGIPSFEELGTIPK